ncbi:Major facilitator superfamily [Kalmanozyma brasiliensis GHG001]|uniref:Major facilitator superfamily (MFS) profile domain-containing protein n=1 Tax=Kalmanozyma brasiliensis (strain GHG001) TaxID=1365824 RepID=V5EV64_KALBG|nr:Major facilitator superfamily [Kalmanozyma brasiliensis GHG001]EST07098.1 Major facilitator superfamily [Kalmanozyma brasiliensis GHG001]
MESTHSDTPRQSLDDTKVKYDYTIFSKSKVAIIVALASWSASFSGISSNIYFPSIAAISRDLEVTPELVNLTVTLYLIFQGLSPSVWAPLSDTKGRRTVILITFVIYFGANVGLALTRSFAQLAVLRAVQSSASASSVAIGAAIVGDVVDRRDRGGYMGFFNAASLLATAVGPVIGGAMAETLGWRSIFWFLVAFGGAFLLCAVVILPETMRNIVGNGSNAPKGLARAPAHRLWVPKELEQPALDDVSLRGTSSTQFSFTHIFKPILLLRNTSVLVSATYASLHYAIWQMSITAAATFFADRYGLDELQVGLTYLSNGGGCIIGTLLAGRLLDWTYRRAQRPTKSGAAPSIDDDKVNLVSARLGTAWTFSLIESAAVLIFGWSIDRQLPLAVPVVFVFFISSGTIASMTAVQTFLVDSFPTQSASASATLNLVRCLMAAAGTSAILPMVNGMTAGWAFTFLTLLMLFSNLAVVFLIHRKPTT